jgi:hypothetical protein
MKKLLVVLLILAAAGGVSAEITWSGQIETGVNIEAKKDEDPTIRLRHSDPEGAELYLSGAATTEDGNFGFLWGIQGDPLNAIEAVTDVINGTTGTLNPVRLDYTRVWGTFFDKKLKILAGSSTGAIFSDGLWHDPGWDSVQGIKFEAAPIEGLSFGASLPLTIDYADLKHAVQETRFGAKYKNDLFEVRGLVKLDDPDDGDADNINGDFTVSVTAVPNFTFNLVGYFINIDKLDTAGYGDLAQRVLYSNSPLTVGLWILEYFDLSSVDATGDNTKFAFYVRPYVEYKLNDSFTPGFRVDFKTGMGGSYVNASPNLNYSILVRPYLTYYLSSNTRFFTYYQLDASKDAADTETLTHTFQLNFGWYF